MANLIKKKPKIFSIDRPIGGSENVYRRDNPISNNFNILGPEWGPGGKWANYKTELFYNNTPVEKFFDNKHVFREKIHTPLEGNTPPDTTYTFHGNDQLFEKEVNSTDTGKKRKEYEALRGLFQKQLFRLLKEKQKQP